MSDTEADAGEKLDYKFTLESMQLAFQQFALIANHVPDADVQAARHACSRALAVGFIFDPTAYRETLFSGSLERQEALIALYIRTKAELKLLFP